MGVVERKQLMEEVKSVIGKSIDLRSDIIDDEVMDLIREEVFRKGRTHHLSATEQKNLADAVFNSLRRLDVLQPLLEDKSVTEIMINGPDRIFVERKGRVVRVEDRFESREKLEDVIQSIVAKVNRTVNEASPMVDARLQDGSRVSVVLPPVALNGPILTIRMFPEEPMTMHRLLEYGTITMEAADLLQRMVVARYNLFISGGTGAGKTSFLNALSNFIPKDERIITIEDSAEMQIPSVVNIVRMETRNANTQGMGEITIRDLIRTSLRMRPERIIVGEVRGPEALDMLQAMNTGHDGSMSTGHANSTSDMLSRLETMVLSGAVLPLDAIRQQMASAIDVIIHLARLRDKSRRVVEITEVVGCVEGHIRLNPLYVFREGQEDCRVEEIKARGHGHTEGEISPVTGSLIRTGNPLQHPQKFRMAGISDRV